MMHTNDNDGTVNDDAHINDGSNGSPRNEQEHVVDVRRVRKASR